MRDYSKNEGNDNETIDQEFIHTVFIEEGTATWCEYCPNVAKILYELYNSGDYNFYYISLIQDKNPLAEKRLTEDYNIVAFPTIYIDGGYRVLTGGTNEKSKYANSIRDAESRESPEIRVTVSAEYNKNTSELTTTILLENNETEIYNGHLKVYLTEIKSRWINQYDDGTKPYHFAFLDYIKNEEISIDSKGNTTVFNKSKISEFEVSNIAPEELMIVAVVFSSKSVKADSFPDGVEGEFDAYYADATDATEVIPGGNIPPTIGLSLPEFGMLHIRGRPILKTLLKNTILIGKTTIVANVEDDSGIEKVEFYINRKLKNTDTEEPYDYSFTKVKLLKRIIRKHTITVIAYDNEGKTSTISIDVIALFL